MFREGQGRRQGLPCARRAAATGEQGQGGACTLGRVLQDGAGSGHVPRWILHAQKRWFCHLPGPLCPLPSCCRLREGQSWSLMLEAGLGPGLGRSPLHCCPRSLVFSFKQQMLIVGWRLAGCSNATGTHPGGGGQQLCPGVWLQHGSVLLAYYGHIIVPLLAFPPPPHSGQCSWRGDQAGTGCDWFLSCRWPLMWSVWGCAGSWARTPTASQPGLPFLLGAKTQAGPKTAPGFFCCCPASSRGTYSLPSVGPSPLPLASVAHAPNRTLSQEGTPPPCPVPGCSWRSIWNACFTAVPITL